MNLKEAIQKGKVRQFVAEHKDKTGDENAFERTVRSMAGKSSEARPASSRDDSDD